MGLQQNGNDKEKVNELDNRIEIIQFEEHREKILEKNQTYVWKK